MRNVGALATLRLQLFLVLMERLVDLEVKKVAITNDVASRVDDDVVSDVPLCLNLSL